MIFLLFRLLRKRKPGQMLRRFIQMPQPDAITFKQSIMTDTGKNYSIKAQ